jgi:3-hydroxyacyl-CoA dehydrogenase
VNVTILGCGLIGASWAALFAAVGRHRVRPKLTNDVCEKLAAGVQAEVRGRDIAQLEEQRDRQLMEILRLRREHPTIDE